MPLSVTGTTMNLIPTKNYSLSVGAENLNKMSSHASVSSILSPTASHYRSVPFLGAKHSK